MGPTSILHVKFDPDAYAGTCSCWQVHGGRRMYVIYCDQLNHQTDRRAKMLIFMGLSTLHMALGRRVSESLMRSP